MRKIRKSMFETNSSSTHSICVTKSDISNTNLPSSINIDLNDYEFGWEYEKYDSIEEKVAYFVLGILDIGTVSKSAVLLENFINILKSFGITNIDISGIRVDCYGSDYYLASEGYIDHGDELESFIDELMNDEDKLKRFLFSPESFILGGNDNNGGYKKLDVNYEHEYYYKGN